MKCDSCGHEGPKATFRYLYNTRLDEPWTYRECPKCYKWVTVGDELVEEQKEKAEKK